MKGKPGDRQRLLHIIEAVEEIQTYTSNTDIKRFSIKFNDAFCQCKAN